MRCNQSCRLKHICSCCGQHGLQQLHGKHASCRHKQREQLHDPMVLKLKTLWLKCGPIWSWAMANTATRCNKMQQDDATRWCNKMQQALQLFWPSWWADRTELAELAWSLPPIKPAICSGQVRPCLATFMGKAGKQLRAHGPKQAPPSSTCKPKPNLLCKDKVTCNTKHLTNNCARTQRPKHVVSIWCLICLKPQTSSTLSSFLCFFL